MGRWAAGLCLSTPGANLPPARPSRLIFALPVVLCRAVLPAVPCLQVWDLSTGAVRQTLERAHSGSEVPCITDLTVWEARAEIRTSCRAVNRQGNSPLDHHTSFLCKLYI